MSKAHLKQSIFSLNITGASETITGSTDFVDKGWSENVWLGGLVVMVKGADWGDTIDVEVGYYAPSWTVVKKFGDTVPMMEETGWQTHRYENESFSEIPTTVKVKVKYNQVDTGTTKKLVVHHVLQK